MPAETRRVDIGTPGTVCARGCEGLFIVSFVFHAVGGARKYTAKQLQHGGKGVSVLQYMQTARLWFESTQNWQSEFLALLGMVVLSNFLRQRGSPESKPVDAPHSQTGSE